MAVPTSVANPMAPAGVSTWNATVSASASWVTSNGVTRKRPISVAAPHSSAPQAQTPESGQTARVASVACTGIS